MADGRRQQRLFGVKVEQIKERRMRVIGSIDVPVGEPLALGDTGKITIEYEVKRGLVEVHDNGSIIETVFVKPGEIAIDGVIVIPAAQEPNDPGEGEPAEDEAKAAE